jgi:hypothetical protein
MSTATCFYGHKLTFTDFRSTDSSQRYKDGKLYCDMCGSQINYNVSLYNCILCNFYACSTCIDYDVCKHDKVSKNNDIKQNVCCTECNTLICEEYYICDYCECDICQVCMQSIELTKNVYNIKLQNSVGRN